MATLQQRFGRGARSPSKEAYAILFVESRHFDDEKAKKQAKTALAAAKKSSKRKRLENAESAQLSRKKARPNNTNTVDNTIGSTLR